MNKARRLEAAGAGIANIRPRHVFALAGQKFGLENCVCHSIVPTVSDGRGGLTFLETAILVSLLKIVEPRHVFEFGTFLGATTVTLAMNSGRGTHITTLDIPPEELDEIHNHAAKPSSSSSEDNAIRDLSALKSGVVIDRARDEDKAKITRTWHNSLTLNVEKAGYRGAFDLVFIDGGHDYRTVKNDTEKALEMMRSGDSIIVWHDFNSPIHTDVTEYVSEFARTRRVAHVGDTMIAFYAPGLEASLF
jgi:predicted O-methyltransferase YrrM